MGAGASSGADVSCMAPDDKRLFEAFQAVSSDYLANKAQLVNVDETEQVRQMMKQFTKIVQPAGAPAATPAPTETPSAATPALASPQTRLSPSKSGGLSPGGRISHYGEVITLDYVLTSILGEFHFTEWIFSPSGPGRIGGQLFGLVLEIVDFRGGGDEDRRAKRARTILKRFDAEELALDSLANLGRMVVAGQGKSTAAALDLDLDALDSNFFHDVYEQALERLRVEHFPSFEGSEHCANLRQDLKEMQERIEQRQGGKGLLRGGGRMGALGGGGGDPAGEAMPLGKRGPAGGLNSPPRGGGAGGGGGGGGGGGSAAAAAGGGAGELTFDTVRQDRLGLHLFKKFCRTHFHEHTLLFVMEVGFFRQAVQAAAARGCPKGAPEVRRAAKVVCAKYVEAGSKLQLELPEGMVKTILATVGGGEEAAKAAAEVEVAAEGKGQGAQETEAQDKAAGAGEGGEEALLAGLASVFDGAYADRLASLESTMWQEFARSQLLRAWRDKIAARILQAGAGKPGTAAEHERQAFVQQADLNYVLGSLLGEFAFTSYVFSPAGPGPVGGQLFGLVLEIRDFKSAGGGGATAAAAAVVGRRRGTLVRGKLERRAAVGHGELRDRVIHRPRGGFAERRAFLGGGIVEVQRFAAGRLALESRLSSDEVRRRLLPLRRPPVCPSRTGVAASIRVGEAAAPCLLRVGRSLRPLRQRPVRLEVLLQQHGGVLRQLHRIVAPPRRR
jgi:hypothetical protein